MSLHRAQSERLIRTVARFLATLVPQAKKLKRGGDAQMLDVEAEAEEEAELSRMRAAGLTGSGSADGGSCA